MKTPEQMAEEYRDLLLQNGERVNVFDAFLAGYQAAKEQLSELRQDIRILNNQLSFFENKVRQMEADRERSK